MEASFTWLLLNGRICRAGVRSPRRRVKFPFPNTHPSQFKLIPELLTNVLPTSLYHFFSNFNPSFPFPNLISLFVGQYIKSLTDGGRLPLTNSTSIYLLLMEWKDNFENTHTSNAQTHTHTNAHKQSKTTKNKQIYAHFIGQKSFSTLYVIEICREVQRRILTRTI